MPTLDNPKHEAFAVLRFEGKSADEAYVLAGYKRNDSNAARLNGNDRVKARLAELAAEAAKAVGITRERWLQELGRVGFADIRKVVAWKANVVGMVEDEDGTPRLAVTNQVQLMDSDQIDDDAAAAVAEISQNAQGGLKIKLHDKLKALELYGRAAGFINDDPANINLNVGVFVDAPPPETREEWLARKERERQERLTNVTPRRTG